MTETQHDIETFVKLKYGTPNVSSKFMSSLPLPVIMQVSKVFTSYPDVPSGLFNNIPVYQWKNVLQIYLAEPPDPKVSDLIISKLIEYHNEE